MVGGKKKWRLYGVGEIGANYIGENDSLKHQPPTSSYNSEDLKNFRQCLSASEAANDGLTRQFQAI